MPKTDFPHTNRSGGIVEEILYSKPVGPVMQQAADDQKYRRFTMSLLLLAGGAYFAAKRRGLTNFEPEKWQKVLYGGAISLLSLGRLIAMKFGI